VDEVFYIELELLLEGILLRYQHDFRDYSQASLRRRIEQAMERFSCATVSQLHRILCHPKRFTGACERAGRQARRGCPPGRGAPGHGRRLGRRRRSRLLLRALPADFCAALAIVLHLAPDRASRLPLLYADRCLLPIREVEDKEPIRVGTVYFAAPDCHMLIERERVFALAKDEAVHFSRPSIDVAMETAALAYGGQMLGIVLSGASADGAAGLALVRRLGGTAWVQDPAQAVASTMPSAALKLAGADRVLNLEQIGAGLARMLKT